MIKKRKLKIPIFAMLLFCGTVLTVHAQEYKHIEKLFDVRTAITNQGKQLPDQIKQATGKDLRTLERIFELNTSALTTIEAYFRLFKMAISQESDPTESTVSILNEWLSFIKNQCTYDSKYLDEALMEVKNPQISEQLKTAKTNIDELSKTVELGIQENPSMATSS